MLRLGRLPRKFKPGIPHFSAMLGQAGQLPPPPVSLDYSKGLPDDLGMMLNDQLGDCTCAAFYHARQIWQFNTTGNISTEPDDDVRKMYEEACGYNPNDATSDNGGCEQDVLMYLLNEGAPVEGGFDKITSFLEVDFRNLDDLKRTIADCGVAYIGVTLPQSVMTCAHVPDVPWDTAGDQTPLGGHAVVLVGYDLDTFTCISWGKRYKITHGFMAQFLDEAYAIVSPDWVKETGKTPLDMTIEQLEDQVKYLKG